MASSKKRKKTSWKKLDAEKVRSQLSKADRTEAEERARETQLRTKTVCRTTLDAGRGVVEVMWGPSPLPVPNEDGDGFLPVSATPKIFQVLWHGECGGDSMPPVVDNDLVFMRGRQHGILMQLWIATAPADVERILLEAFGLRSKLVMPVEAQTN